MIFSTVASPVSFQEGKASSCGCSEPMDAFRFGKGRLSFRNVFVVAMNLLLSCPDLEAQSNEFQTEKDWEHAWYHTPRIARMIWLAVLQ